MMKYCHMTPRQRRPKNQLQLNQYWLDNYEIAQKPDVTPRLTMSKHKQTLTRIDTTFSKRRREKTQKRNDVSLSVTQTFTVTNDMCAVDVPGERQLTDSLLQGEEYPITGHICSPVSNIASLHLSLLWLARLTGFRASSTWASVRWGQQRGGHDLQD